MPGGTFFERHEGAASKPLGPRYSPRRPEKTLLHQVVCANLETLLAQAREQGDGAGLPAFVENEFRRYVDCGCLARGFIRVQCARCGHEEVAGFSCKCRGFCPSCIARRMDDTAAHLVDRVLPLAPYRQWVLSLPFRLRLRLARNDELLAAMRRVFVAAVGRWQRRKARELGLRGARTAVVCVTQRFDSLLRVNPHFHALVPDADFEAMVAVVHRHGGVVNKFLGDGLMALFGAPDHARRAARAALEMQEVVRRTRAQWRFPDLQVGIGICSGEAVVGVIGARARCEYTAIGDTVNLASRLEALNKERGTRILLSVETRALLDPRMAVRALGEARVKGREQPVALYELLEAAPAASCGDPRR